MPTYGYQCTQCKHEFQAFQAMKDAPISECPECDGAVKRLLYPVGVVFKGSGWYINDSRKSEPTESKSEAADSSAGEKASTDSAQAAKPVEKTASEGGAAKTTTSETSSSGTSSSG